MKITIYHLYPTLMNLYGDRGNILTLLKRSEWRGIEVIVKEIGLNDPIDLKEADILFMGGGQDKEQERVAIDLVAKGPFIKEAVEDDLVGLTICGAFQLFGKYFLTGEGKELKGIEIFDAYTEAGNRRLIGNVIVDCRELTKNWGWEIFRATLVGFENHSGKTFINPQSGKTEEEQTLPLGYVTKGFGNNGQDRTEGAVYKNLFGTYLHGSLLPKNPWLADHLILTALQRRYGTDFEFPQLDDNLEYKAHETAIKRAYTAKTSYL